MATKLFKIPSSLTQGRAQFLAACERAGAEVQSHLHPLRGRQGQELYCDVARLGPGDAKRWLVLISGVHGVETLPGSGLQSHWMDSGDIPSDMGVLMIHAINCWGAEYDRRYTHENVDLCRNFLNFEGELPVNAEYERLHPCLEAHPLNSQEWAKAAQGRAEFIKERGMQAFVQALMGGQYAQPQGFGFGGQSATWSRQVLEKALAPLQQTAEDVAVIEVHTGFGPWAYGTAVTMAEGEDLERVRQWFGPWVVAPHAPDPGALPASHKVQGHTQDGIRAVLPKARLSAVVLEVGTYPPMQTLPVMLEDHAIWRHGLMDSERGLEVAALMRKLHSPEDADWAEAFRHRGLQVLAQAIRGLDPHTPAN